MSARLNVVVQLLPPPHHGPAGLVDRFSAEAAECSRPLWVAKQMGHKDVQMIFRVYGKYMPDMNPEAGQKMSNSKGNIRAA